MENKGFELKNVAIRMVEHPPFLSDEPVNSPEAAVRVLSKELKDYDREVVCVVNMNAKSKPINASIVSMGVLDGSLVHPREMLKSAILSNAASILMIHNHPSGEVSPSKEDVKITDRMQKVCEMVGIPLADHVIISGKEYFSFRENAVLPIPTITYTSNLEDISFPGVKVAEAMDKVSSVSENENNGSENLRKGRYSDKRTSVMDKLKEKQAVVEKNDKKASLDKTKLQNASR